MPDPTPHPDPALQALSDAIGRARARRPEDAADPEVPVAATVVLLRDGAADESGAGGPEVLMIERPDRGSFPGAWVFPGGKLEDADRLVLPLSERGGELTTSASSRDAAAQAEPEETVARRASVRETREETGLSLDVDALVTLSCWDPPPGLALRIRTWFFLAPGTADALSLSADEAVSAEWMRPSDALARHGRGELTLYPPTWVTLHGLAAHADAASALAAARLSGVQHFETVARRGGEGPLLLWQDDDEYDPEASGAASGSRHRLEIGSLPWRYEHTG